MTMPTDDPTPWVFFDPAMIDHDPGHGHPERPDRLRVLQALLNASAKTRVRLQTPPLVERSGLTAVHEVAHVDTLLALDGATDSIDPDTCVSPGTIRAARMAAGASIAAVDALMAGETRRCFALVRPPGHHAEAARAMGFCLFNNVAVAAHHARTVHGLERILVVDWDVHHGNGTQDIFYGDPGVLFFSTHQFPFYPGTGARHECGRGPGVGYTVNVPFGEGATDGDLRLAFEDLLVPIADAFRPQLVLVSAGFDGHRRDPLGGWDLSADGFADLCALTADIADEHAEGRLGLLLEGGYDLEGLSSSVLHCLQVLGGATAPMGRVSTSRLGEASVRATAKVQQRYWKL